MKYAFVAVFLILVASANAGSQYAGQETRHIKALSSAEISDLLAGKGMGFAKAAELNGYPGPLHVLELATELALTSEQHTMTEELFRNMKIRAIALGKKLVKQERALDQLFASRKVTAEELGSVLDRISTLRGAIRGVHLEAHLRQTAMLKPEQVAKYVELRGYHSGGHQGHEQQSHH